ncbi:MAG: DUF5906 domain-containing protein [Clostridiales bacterium]|nr:DUF5906 domain-containing protein [Clostridiales bacterium]
MHEETNPPCWVLRGDRVDELAFANEFLTNHHMVSVNGTFFTPDGRLSDENALRKDIFQVISRYIRGGLARKVDSILATLHLACQYPCLDDSMTQVQVQNGTWHLDGSFSTFRDIVVNRLPVAYHPDAPKPERWLQFVDELLEPGDVLTLQEYMGYCLLPVTFGQKMLIIIGRGGEGKSRIGTVMKDLLGDNMYMGSIAKIENSPFARADLEHMLLMVDDDLKMEALKQTNYIKSIVTAELPMDLERKGIQSYQGRLYCRFMAFGNGNLRSLYDRSYGFFRRQLILTTRDRPRNRQDDPYLSIQLRKEKEGILLWCLEGLQRLFYNDFQFTVTPLAEENLNDAIREGNNAVDFMKSEGYFRFDSQGSVTSRALYHAYRDWCDDNAMMAMSSSSFITYINQNQRGFGITYSTNIPIGNGRYARGYKGIRCLH